MSANEIIVNVEMLIEGLKEHQGETIADICSDALIQETIDETS